MSKTWDFVDEIPPASTGTKRVSKWVLLVEDLRAHPDKKADVVFESEKEGAAKKNAQTQATIFRTGKVRGTQKGEFDAQVRVLEDGSVHLYVYLAQQTPSTEQPQEPVAETVPVEETPQVETHPDHLVSAGH